MEHQLATGVVTIDSGAVEGAVNYHHGVDVAIAPVREVLEAFCDDGF